MSLQVWLPLIGTLENKGLKPLTISTVDTTITNDGKLGPVYNFSATTSVIRSAASECNITREHWSVGCWFYQISSSASAHQWMVGIHRGSTASAFQFVLCSYRNALSLRCAGTTRNGPSISLNKWHHGMAVYDGTNLYFYLDGILSLTTTLPTTQDATAATLVIGNRLSNAGAFQGKIQDVRIYDNALSAAEVKEIAQGLMLHYKLDNGGMNNLLKNSNNFTAADFACTRSTVPSNGILQVTPTSSAAYAKYITDLDYDFYNNKTYTVSYDMQEIEPSVDTYTSSSMRVYYGYTIASRSAAAFSSSYDRYAYKTISTIGPGWHHYSVSFSIPDELTTGKTEALVSGSNLCVEFYRVASRVPVQIKNIKLEIGNKDTGYTLNPADLNIDPTVVEDSSGYNNNGEIIGTITSSPESPRYIKSLYFNNTPYIRKTNFNFVSNEWTISAWCKKTSTITSSFETICGLTRDTGTDSNKKFSVYIYNNQLGFVGEGTAHSNIITTDTSIWHHVCVTNNQGTYKYYLDGELIQTYTNSNNLTDCTDFVVGARSAETDASSITTPWGGYISDVRLYCTPLLDNEVKQLYNVSMRIDNKNNIHAFEIIENNKNKINKQGQLMCNEINEINFTTNVKNFSNNNWQAYQIIER